MNGVQAPRIISSELFAPGADARSNQRPSLARAVAVRQTLVDTYEFITPNMSNECRSTNVQLGTAVCEISTLFYISPADAGSDTDLEGSGQYS